MTLEVTCPKCGGLHNVPLDASGHYSGPPPCDPTSHKRWQLQVDPQAWRELVERRAQETPQ